MPTRNVVVTDQQSDFIDNLVTSGRYQNASEAFRAGLRLLEQAEMDFLELRVRLEAGIEEYRRGDFVEGDGEEAIRRIFEEARIRAGN
jgi:antitoxin ParD1/3/4